MLKYIVYLAVTYSHLCVRDCTQCNFPFQILQLVRKKTTFYFGMVTPCAGVSTAARSDIYEGWNFNSGNYLFTSDTK